VALWIIFYVLCGTQLDMVNLGEKSGGATFSSDAVINGTKRVGLNVF
jgi:hypothetical protein